MQPPLLPWPTKPPPRARALCDPWRRSSSRSRFRHTSPPPARNLGLTEGEVWEREVLAWPDPAHDPSASGVGEDRAPNPRLLGWGLPRRTALAALNPGFRDPFPASTTVTLDNPRYRLWRWSLMAGKLDWVLLRGLRPCRAWEGNATYELSDHKWLAAEVQA